MARCASPSVTVTVAAMPATSDGHAAGEFPERVGAHEPTNRFAPVDVGEFVVRPVPSGGAGVHAAAACTAAALILLGDASGVHGPEAQ